MAKAALPPFEETAASPAAAGNILSDFGTSGKSDLATMPGKSKKGSRKMKVSINYKPFVSRVVRNGSVQQAFRDKIGHRVGKCVSDATAGRDDLSKGLMKAITKKCASTVKGKVFGGTFLPKTATKADKNKRKRGAGGLGDIQVRPNP